MVLVNDRKFVSFAGAFVIRFGAIGRRRCSEVGDVDRLPVFLPSVRIVDLSYELDSREPYPKRRSGALMSTLPVFETYLKHTYPIDE